jgi:hypothetical protein
LLGAFITTIRHNIGDDFVREGVRHLIRAAGYALEAELIHKHSPVTNVYGWENIRSRRVSSVVDPALRLIRARNRVSSADILVQSGAPVYWCHPQGWHCADNEWYGPLIKKRFLTERRGRKFLNIAGGSCQRYHSDGSELAACDKCLAYMADFFDACDLTILRDELARKMLRMAGREAAVLPCASIFARDELQIEAEKGEYIVLNFMEAAGHFSFGQHIDTEKWRRNFLAILQAAMKKGDVVVACHNTNELELARNLVGGVSTFLVPDDHVEFMRFYARARFGIVNRVHAGFMMASFGKPAFVIGTDSRARMTESLDLPSCFVEDIENAEELVENIAAMEHEYFDVASTIRQHARHEYTRLISGSLEG